MKRFLFAVLIVFVVSPAWAIGTRSVGGNELHEWCRNPAATSQSVCHSFIIGTIDALGGIGTRATFDGNAFCIPDTGAVTKGQIVDIVKNWLNNNPQDRHYAAVSSVSEALSKAFPCR
jgi:hypothetical protein